jgi:hypothetical protein
VSSLSRGEAAAATAERFDELARPEANDRAARFAGLA